MTISSQILAFTLIASLCIMQSSGFSIEEATIDGLQLAFKQNQLTSRQLVEFYIRQIHKLNPLLRGVIEVNPDALTLADKADQDRRNKVPGSSVGLHGIPILLKDNIATKDKLNTTAGSLALLGSIVPRDAGVAAKLRKAGAIILGKASLSEWANFRSYGAPSGFCARSGQGKASSNFPNQEFLCCKSLQNPYVLSADPCGSSSGSGISVAANMAAVSLGTETDGSILCPSSANSVVGIKPTVGLTSRAGVIPISPRQDTVGPMCRTVADAVYVLDAIAGFDRNDPATKAGAKYIPRGGYKQFLKPDGLKGKRLGIVRDPFFTSYSGFDHHFQTLRQKGAVLIDNLRITNLGESYSDENLALVTEFKPALNAYLKELIASPVRSLADVIAFNNKFSKQASIEKIKEYGQGIFEEAESIKGFDASYKAALQNLTKISRDGFEKLMRKNKLDALVTPDSSASSILAIGGHPGIVVPAGYDKEGLPFGICFGGLRGSEPKLIEIAYSFEQATNIRRPPSFQA
ncbi:hypothetical protein Tsubulata_030779 [Turnera subulata]|uniref:Amidase domain-containing protein n=1 Tax=Turnera subulata TaxID=218843 RepID=A0A9Q0FJE5_9ROSI|nr:hypothetical protein Tsubulata_030779 [Turnera subulata]